MDDWKKTNETSLPEKKKDVYCHLNMDYFTHADYGNRKGVYKDFEINFFGKWHDFYIERDTSFLADAFRNFRKKFINFILQDWHGKHF